MILLMHDGRMIETELLSPKQIHDLIRENYNAMLNSEGYKKYKESERGTKK